MMPLGSSSLCSLGCLLVARLVSCLGWAARMPVVAGMGWACLEGSPIPVSLLSPSPRTPVSVGRWLGGSVGVAAVVEVVSPQSADYLGPAGA